MVNILYVNILVTGATNGALQCWNTNKYRHSCEAFSILVLHAKLRSRLGGTFGRRLWLWTSKVCRDTYIIYQILGDVQFCSSAITIAIHPCADTWLFSRGRGDNGLPHCPVASQAWEGAVRVHHDRAALEASAAANPCPLQHSPHYSHAPKEPQKGSPSSEMLVPIQCHCCTCQPTPLWGTA